MNKEEAKYFLTHYICCCQYGTSPTNCDDDKCKFGMAIRMLCDEVIICRPEGRNDSSLDRIIRPNDTLC